MYNFNALCKLHIIKQHFTKKVGSKSIIKNQVCLQTKIQLQLDSLFIINIFTLAKLEQV